MPCSSSKCASHLSRPNADVSVESLIVFFLYNADWRRTEALIAQKVLSRVHGHNLLVVLIWVKNCGARS